MHNSETNNNNGKYDIPPKKNFSIKSAKKINKEEIINNINNKIKIEEIYSINWLGKKYFRMTKKKDIKRLNNIYYYCINHRTLKNSTESNKKGEPKRISLCNARLIYVKDIEEFYTDWEHSSYCNNQKAQEYQNLGDINEQINNYKDLKEKLTLYLNTHSMITVGEFIKKGYKLYDKCSCKFNVENYTFKNIYYNWRKSSLSFKKYSSLEYPNTKENTPFLRDYSYITLYNASGKSQFIHEHLIFVSNYFIKKLSQSVHLYIDGTFIYPPGFNQLIVILYRDENSGVRYPGLFALINNKKYEGYIYLFEKINFLITVENTIELNLVSYSIDFEKALINATNKVFKNKRQVGCFYHYCRNIRERAVEMGLFKKINKDEANNFLNEFYKMPFLFYQNNKILDDIKLNYSKKNSLYEDYLIYFENQWLQYFHNGMLNYQFLSKEQRSNSYIENYNRRIKLKLSKFLYGKNKCKITWPLFLYFIKQEEEDYRTDIYNKEKELTIKYKKI